MTIRDAVQARVRFVRLPEWARTVHIELPILPEGQTGPWAIVRDPAGEVSVLLLEFLNDTESRYEAC